MEVKLGKFFKQIGNCDALTFSPCRGSPRRTGRTETLGEYLTWKRTKVGRVLSTWFHASHLKVALCSLLLGVIVIVEVAVKSFESAIRFVSYRALLITSPFSLNQLS